MKIDLKLVQKQAGLLKGKINKVKKDGLLKKIQKDIEKAQDAYLNTRLVARNYSSHLLQPYKRLAIVFNVAQWKRKYVLGFLREYRVLFYSVNMDLELLHIATKLSHAPVFIMWGRHVPRHLSTFADFHQIPIYHIEDGFIRSIGLGANHVPPLSLCLDKTGLYYDANQPSDLENILNTYDFDSNPKLMSEAVKCLNFIKEHQLSKYNENNSNLAKSLYGTKTNDRILVLGQVEDDQSLIYGCDVVMTNVQLIEKALEENPNAQVIYKPHPDVLCGKRKELSELSGVEDRVEIFKVPMSLADALYEVDKVYTLTSLGGFEALIHGVAVTTFGAPFYSGWGVTDDRQVTTRRKRKLSLEQIFAAAYILYPRYRLNDGLTEVDLYTTLQHLQEKLASIHLSASFPIEKEASFYNFATTHPLALQYFAKATHSRTMILTDKKESLQLAEELSVYNKSIDVITTRDTLANDPAMFVKNEYINKVKIASIHKIYSQPMSKTESQSMRYAKIFSSDLFKVLSIVSNSLVPESILKQMSEGIEDYIYMEILRFNGYQDLLQKYDHLLIYFDDYNSSKDVVDSLRFHGEKMQCLSKMNLAFKNIDDTKSFLRNSVQHKLDVKSQSISEYKEKFAKFWWSIEYQDFKNLKTNEEKVVICGNIADENYAYFPSALRLLDVAVNIKKTKVVYINAAIPGASVQDKLKAILLKYNYAENCEVYSGNVAEFRQKYEVAYVQAEQFFRKDLTDFYIHELKKHLPSEFISIVHPRISAYIDTLPPLIVMMCEFKRLMSSATAFLTSMERGHVSRILVETARELGISSIGIQPQVMSESDRYKGSIVDKMGVIDTKQYKVYQALGSVPESLHIVGSANIIERLLKMEEAHQSVETSLSKSTLFFAMQHSLSEEMMLIGQALNNISKKHKFRVLVKPHPMQELPVLNRIKDVFADNPNVILLSRDSDTYKAIADSEIVVGLFSSVLLESAIYGKPVIVADFKDLHESIDYSQLGVAIKTQQEDELERVILDLFNQGVEYKKLKQNRDAYLNDNPQFKPPYNTRYLDKFILDSLNS